MSQDGTMLPSSSQNPQQQSGSSQGQLSDVKRAFRLLTQAVQHGAASASTSSRGPSLRDLPKDAFEKPKISCDLTGTDRSRLAVVIMFLRKLHRYLTVYSSVLVTDDLKLDVISGCFPAGFSCRSLVSVAQEDLGEFRPLVNFVMLLYPSSKVLRLQSALVVLGC
jgi:hypothetical protein